MSRVASLEAFADRDPTNPDLLCDLLDSLVLEGQVQRARERLERAPQALRAMPGVVFRDARLALVEGDLPKVIALLNPLVSALQPAPAGLCHDLAYAQFTLGEPDEALRTLSRASAVEGDDVISIALLTARIWHRQQRIREALALLDGLHDPSRQAEIDGLRALLLLDHGQVSDAAREASRALSLDPAQFEAGLVSGSLALSARHEDAVSIFQRLVAMRPNVGRAYLGLGEGLMMSGDIVAATAVLDRAVTYMPDHIGTWHALAWCQLLQGKLDDAQRSFDQAFALDRTFGETHGGRALIHALRGEREAASESIKRALRLDPHGRNARYAQSVLLLDEGREAEAQSIIQDLVASPQAGRPLVSPDFVNTLRDLLRPKQGGSRGH
ncbi:tetratricopeptide repeat protein [Dyella terrae]|uniref:tetratricopeptide repeat protein n=1 Tax=Dyella terrae TaxID=522259 RepID=UPI001EFD46E8|nr:tetratricopeptide repeat protein [Dyella terrae]ULU23697.1 tetratricopeptide repeat protein [Dyella terrae]